MADIAGAKIAVLGNCFCGLRGVGIAHEHRWSARQYLAVCACRKADSIVVDNAQFIIDGLSVGFGGAFGVGMRHIALGRQRHFGAAIDTVGARHGQHIVGSAHQLGGNRCPATGKALKTRQCASGFLGRAA